MKVTIYTDGGADPNPGIGGWAAILKAGHHEKILKGNHPSTTNNRMELQAAIAALEALTRPAEVEFHTDSDYLRLGITEWIDKWEAEGWRRKGKPVANADLWQQLRKLAQRHNITWYWVRGHSGDALNERVDSLAREARLEITSHPEHFENVPRLYLRSSCKGNPGPGGWGVLLEIDSDTEQLSGSDPSTTNNRMELTAAIEGLLMVAEGSMVQIVTASDYLFQGATKWIHGWRRRNWMKRDGKPVSNLDLWRRLDQLFSKYDIIWINAKEAVEETERGLAEAGLLAVSAAELEQN